MVGFEAQPTGPARLHTRVPLPVLLFPILSLILYADSELQGCVDTPVVLPTVVLLGGYSFVCRPSSVRDLVAVTICDRQLSREQVAREGFGASTMSNSGISACPVLDSRELGT